MGWGVEVLVEGLLRVECPIALLTFEEVSWGIEVLLQYPLTIEVSITRLTVLGHFAQRLLRRCILSWNSVRRGNRHSFDASGTSASPVVNFASRLRRSVSKVMKLC